MTTILHIKSSSNYQGSITRKIGELAIETLKNQHNEAVIIERDLIQNTIAHVTPKFVAALFSENDNAEELALSDKLIDELFSSNIIVIEAPMYNFNIPSVLKAWIDHIVRAKKTFHYTQSGPEGLLKEKKVILILSSGGLYSDGPTKALDYQEPYLRTILNFIGIFDIELIRIEGTALGQDTLNISLSQATEKALSLR